MIQENVVRFPANSLQQKISDSKSTIQSGIFTQNAGESLVDLTIDPNSQQREFGLAFIESSSFNSTFDENAAYKI